MAKEEEVAEDTGPRSQMWKHEGFVEWYGTEHGEDLDQMSAADIIARFAARRNEFRKTDFYRELISSHDAEVEEAKEARAAERAEAAAAKKAEREAAKAAEDKETKAPAKASAKKAAATTKKVAKATRKGGKAEASPFE